MKKMYLYAFTSILVVLGMITNPAATQATENNITTVTVDAISDTTPSILADYTVTFDILFGTQSVLVRIYPVADDGTIGDSTLSGFNFSTTTFTSDTLPAATGMSVSNGREYSIMFDSAVSTGTYTMTLHDVENSATEGNYQLALSTAFNATDADFIQSDAFTIATDPCTDIVTTELTGVSAEAYGTNVSVTRGDSDPVGTTYTLAYATSQEAIDTDTASTVDMTANTTALVEDLIAQTLYYFQVSSMDANNCVLARTSTSTTTERTITAQRYSQPTVNHITKRSAVAHWLGNDYVDTYDLQLWFRKKLLKRFNHLTVLKKTLTKKQLQSMHIYKIRVRANYHTGETTRWSKFTKFSTK